VDALAKDPTSKSLETAKDLKALLLEDANENLEDKKKKYEN
jgi:hypothetical protein